MIKSMKLPLIKANGYLCIALLFFLTSLSTVSQNPDRKFESYHQFPDRLEIYVNDGLYIIKPYTEKMLETTFVPKGQKFTTQSHAVILKPESIQTDLVETEESILLSTKGISLHINKSPFQISYFYANQLLISEKAGYIKTDTTEELEFNLNETEILYGGGARVLGMDRRGYRLELYNRAHYGYTTHSELMNYCLPMVLSSKMYAVHFDNPAIGFLDLDSKGNNTLVYETISGRKTYQVITGDSWPDLIDQYTDLTGKQPLPPRWAFGNYSSRFGYHSEKEVRETVGLFLEDSIPLDAVVIDIYWFGPDIQGHMGNLEFNTDSFPTPWQMMADFKSKGINTVLVTEPFILTTSKKWEEAVKEQILATDGAGNPFTYDFYFGNTGLIDIFKSEGEAWFWDFYHDFTEKGVDGWWGDLGEPEVHPSDLIHATGTADEVHNIYGHNWARLIFEGYQCDFPDQRPFILMRSGYSGSQRFGLIPWTGDVDRSWGGLQPQTEISLQMGMQGIGYMHSDLGGFAGGEVIDPELYTRWLQYGVFQPIYRPHAQEHIPAEPVFHDPKTKALAKKSIELRYSLLPYLYTIAFENNQTGMPLMRPLFFEEPGNKEILLSSSTYFWGENFLVSPVRFKSQTEMEIYFPLSGNWFDFYDGEKYTGGSKETIKLADDHIPVFVRGGAFIPMIEPVQSTREYSTEEITLHYYFDPEASETSDQLYDDNGMTPNAFEKGKYELMTFSAKVKSGEIKIELKSETGENYSPSDRKINLVIHNLPELPDIVKIDDNTFETSWDQEKRLLQFGFIWNANTSPLISVEL
jgi:alpha-glucosidase/oligosaccharide 4-alpha-D-glucosyltransferase